MTDIIIAAGKLTLTGHAAGVLTHRRPHFYLVDPQCNPPGHKCKGVTYNWPKT